MKLQKKALFIFGPLQILSFALLLVLSKQAIQDLVIQETVKRGMQKGNEFAITLAPWVKIKDEKTLFSQLLNQAQILESGYCFVLSNNGTVLGHTNVTEEGKIYDDLQTKNALSSIIPVFQRTTYLGKPILDIAIPIFDPTEDKSDETFLLEGNSNHSLNSKIGVYRFGIPLDNAFLTAKLILIRLGLILMVIGIIVLIIAFLFIRHILVSLELLARKTDQISRGEYGLQIPVGSKDELGKVAISFNNMSQKLAETTVGKDFFSSIINHMKDPLLVFNNDGRVQMSNRASQLIFEMSDERLKSYSMNDLVIIKINLTELKLSSLNIENYFISSSGNNIPVIFSVSPLLSEKNEITGYVGVAKDITIQKKTAEELKKAKVKAEEATRIKSEFLANMSHEIRTPMNGIMGLTEMLLETPLNEDQRHDLQMVYQSSHSLLGIINDILDFSKIESGKLKLEIREFKLTDILRDTINLMQHGANKKNISCTFKSAPDLPNLILADDLRLKQVLINLLGNAIKFTNHGGVSLICEVKEKYDDGILIHFIVKDTGIGIPADKLDLIFQAFTQVDGTITRQYGGTGLGLTISRQLIQLMGGNIWVLSTPGEGSEFHFTIRCQTSIVKNVINPELKTQVSTLNSRSFKILLAEDNVINQHLASVILRKQGHEVRLAPDGLAAIAAFEKEAFDIILMDGQMPRMDGIQATGIIRQKEKEKNTHIPIIALTANALEGDKEKFLAAGMDGYVSKPLKPQELFETMLKTFQFVNEKYKKAA